MSDPSSATPLPMGLMPRARRKAWRTWYGLKRRFVPYRGDRGPIVVRVCGLRLLVLPGVFDPSRFFSTEVLISAIRAEPLDAASQVLDLGTGSRAAAIAAAERSGRVVGTDIDRLAVTCARANVERLGLSGRVEIRHGDLWGPAWDDLSDLVVCNPPYQVGDPVDRADVAFHAPPSFGGRFAGGLADHLRPGGRALLVLSSNGDPDAFIGPLREHGFAVDAVLTRDRGSEILTCWRFTLA